MKKQLSLLLLSTFSIFSITCAMNSDSDTPDQPEISCYQSSDQQLDELSRQQVSQPHRASTLERMLSVCQQQESLYVNKQNNTQACLLITQTIPNQHALLKATNAYLKTTQENLRSIRCFKRGLEKSIIKQNQRRRKLYQCGYSADTEADDATDSDSSDYDSLD